jgi:hypothetical protein
VGTSAVGGSSLLLSVVCALLSHPMIRKNAAKKTAKNNPSGRLKKVGDFK